MARQSINSYQQAGKINGPEGAIDYILIRSDSRKTITITVRLTGHVYVHAPASVDHSEIIKFLQSKSSWVSKHLRKIQMHNKILSSKSFEHGKEFLFLGKKYHLEIKEEPVKRTRINFDGTKWMVGVSQSQLKSNYQESVAGVLSKWYQCQAREILGSRVFHYSRQMGVELNEIVIKAQRRIWGSCHPVKRKIHLNWQIIMSPMEIIDYVVVHELCHLLVANHSKRFWKKVEKVLPDYKERKKWLRNNFMEMYFPRIADEY